MNGVDGFVAYVFTLEEFRVAGVSRCSCSKCCLLNWIGPQEMTLHLYRNGFNPGYWIWTSHGEMDEDNINHFETRAQRCKTNWAVVVKTKPMGRLETELPETSEPFQVDVPNPARPVPETEPPDTLVNPLVDDDVVLIQLSNRLGEDEENEEPHGDTEEEEFIDDDISSSEPEEEPILPDSD
ncbi:hypothetical protein PIB30_058400 [Stylosanthes scabra]|uniref:Transposase-associated domain-containing protein n=1 Tax=Stylosanthes scabra TaxID=79078 RepID=A0ABU6RL05_9FABA|nr:hypothetical protein [Stylosanthes scabra]